jgi:pyruvate dehydrogenase E1 component alpha subunit
LLGLGHSKAELDGIDAETRAEVDKATAVARAGATPDPGLAITEVWADGGAAWRN